jgi:tetratricopeptide (TPR) repeat protein
VVFLEGIGGEVFYLFFLIGLLLGQSVSATDSNYEQGVAALQQERVQAAAYFFRNAVANDPAHSQAWLQLAEVRIDLGELKEAEEAYRRALEGSATRSDAQVGLAALLTDLGRTEESQRLLEETLRMDPGPASAHFEMARLLEHLKKPNLAAEHYAKAIAEGVSDPRASYRLSLIYSGLGEASKALNELRRAFELAPERYVARVVNSLQKVRNEFDQIRYLPEFRELLDEYQEYWPEKRKGR